jgi:hypothetical protein
LDCWRGCAEENLEIADVGPPRELLLPFGGAIISECLIYSINFNLHIQKKTKEERNEA